MRIIHQKLEDKNVENKIVQKVKELPVLRRLSIWMHFLSVDSGCPYCLILLRQKCAFSIAVLFSRLHHSLSFLQVKLSSYTIFPPINKSTKILNFQKPLWTPFQKKTVTNSSMWLYPWLFFGLLSGWFLSLFWVKDSPAILTWLCN